MFAANVSLVSETAVLSMFDYALAPIELTAHHQTTKCLLKKVCRNKISISNANTILSVWLA